MLLSTLESHLVLVISFLTVVKILRYPDFQSLSILVGVPRSPVPTLTVQPNRVLAALPNLPLRYALHLGRKPTYGAATEAVFSLSWRCSAVRIRILETNPHPSIKIPR